jgi:hypothetical protein
MMPSAGRRPVRPDVFEMHARSFEPPTADEQPVVYDRVVPVEEWVLAHLVESGASEARTPAG